MSTLKILLAEIGYRLEHFALSVLAVVIAVTLFVAGPILVDGYRRATQVQVERWQSRLADLEAGVVRLKDGMDRLQGETDRELARLDDETRKLMLEMGFNLLIVHRGTNMSDFWAEDFAAQDMPQEYVNKLAADRRLTLVTHLVATLQGKMEWEGRKVLLVGYLPETTQLHMRHKAPMGYRVEQGTVLLGHELAAGKKAGDTIRVGDKDFTVAQVLPEQGSKEDITIAMHLADAQSVLLKPGKINQIMALGCQCAGANLPNIRKQLADVLPETQITEFRTIALARAEQRSMVAVQRQAILGDMRRNLQEREAVLAERKQITADLEQSRAQIQRIMETLARVITPLVVLVSAVWVGLLALANVRQRRTEIGVLRALGKGSWTIGSLLLGKAVLVGVLGAVLGVVLGVVLAWQFGVRALGVGAGQFPVPYDFLIYALVGAPLLSALASYLPTLTALREDPAVVLREP